MKSIHCLTLSLLFFAFGISIANGKATSDPYLTRLEEGFQARLQADVEEPYQAALAELNHSYLVNGIPPARASAQQKGNLYEVNELDAEKERIEAGDGVPPEDLESTPESLKQLRAIYRETHEKLLEDRERKTAPLYDIYIEALDKHIVKVTRNGRIDHANKIKALRDSIAGRKSLIVKSEAEVLLADTPEPVSEVLVANITATDEPTAPLAAFKKADVLDARVGASPEDLVRWALSVGANIMVRVDGETTEVRSYNDIPRGRFEVIAFELRDSEDSKDITDDDFRRFAGHEELVKIGLNGVKVGDSAFAFCGSTPKLRELYLHNLPITDDVMVYLAHLPELVQLSLQGAKKFTGSHLAYLPTLPQLTSLDLQHSGITDAGLLHLAEARKLERLNLGNTSVTDAGAASLGGLSALKELKLDECKKLKGSFLEAWPKMPELRELNIGRCPIEKEYYSALSSRHTQLEDLGIIDNPNFDDDALSQLAPLVRLKTLSLTGTKINGSGFHSLNECTAIRELYLGNTKISGKGIATIAATFPWLGELDFAYTLEVSPEDLRPLADMERLGRLTMSKTTTDAALVEIAEIPNLNTLFIQNSQITAEGLNSLKGAKKLKELNISGCEKIDDSAIPALKRLRNLENVHLSGTSISKEAMAKLKKSKSINWNIR